MVYVISQSGKALMPTNRHGKVRHLLREGKARDKFTDLLAARGADWDIRMRRLDDADLERERRIFGAS